MKPYIWSLAFRHGEGTLGPRSATRLIRGHAFHAALCPSAPALKVGPSIRPVLCPFTQARRRLHDGLKLEASRPDPRPSPSPCLCRLENI